MKVISVGQLNRYVKTVLEGDKNLASVYIGGEISNFTYHYKSGHMYMSLKDESAVVKAVMFRGHASQLAFKPEDGMKVIVRARVSLYEATGAFQSVCHKRACSTKVEKNRCRRIRCAWV